MTRRSYVQVDGVLYEKGTEPVSNAGPMVMPDIEPYRSMIDGSIIKSRSHHREHLRAHGYEEVGNDPAVLNPRPRGIPDVKPEQRHELIRSQIAAMPHSQFKSMLRRDLDNIRWNSRKD